MARKLRVEYSRAIYPVINRGDRREPIFQDDADRRRFLETLDQVCARTEWQVHAYCLMGNHFHLVLETPQANLVAVKEEMARREWNGTELAQRRKANVEKIKIARRLRAETTVTWGWIAQCLMMGTPGYTADCLRKT